MKCRILFATFFIAALLTMAGAAKAQQYEGTQQISTSYLTATLIATYDGTAGNVIVDGKADLNTRRLLNPHRKPLNTVRADAMIVSDGPVFTSVSGSITLTPRRSTMAPRTMLINVVGGDFDDAVAQFATAVEAAVWELLNQP